ncbi:hypothetical protein IFO70_35280 [Phormidium tenue FACHB-886]|nr:hypothetical protein [Phormidium tenue FACHB-886]
MTRGKQETRSIPVSPELRHLLEEYRSDRSFEQLNGSKEQQRTDYMRSSIAIAT